MSSTRPRMPPASLANWLPHGHGSVASSTRSPVRCRLGRRAPPAEVGRDQSPSAETSKVNSVWTRWTPPPARQPKPVGPKLPSSRNGRRRAPRKPPRSGYPVAGTLTTGSPARIPAWISRTGKVEADLAGCFRSQARKVGVQQSAVAPKSEDRSRPLLGGHRATESGHPPSRSAPQKTDQKAMNRGPKGERTAKKTAVPGPHPGGRNDCSAQTRLPPLPGLGGVEPAQQPGPARG